MAAIAQRHRRQRSARHRRVGFQGIPNPKSCGCRTAWRPCPNATTPVRRSASPSIFRASTHPTARNGASWRVSAGSGGRRRAGTAAAADATKYVDSQTTGDGTSEGIVQGEDDRVCRETVISDIYSALETSCFCGSPGMSAFRRGQREHDNVLLSGGVRNGMRGRDSGQRYCCLFEG